MIFICSVRFYVAQAYVSIRKHMFFAVAIFVQATPFGSQICLLHGDILIGSGKQAHCSQSSFNRSSVISNHINPNIW